MVDTVLTMELGSVTDDVLPNRLGTFERFKKYVFYLGRFGPFTERIPLDNTDPNEFSNRVSKLRADLIRQQQH